MRTGEEVGGLHRVFVEPVPNNGTPERITLGMFGVPGLDQLLSEGRLQAGVSGALASIWDVNAHSACAKELHESIVQGALHLALFCRLQLIRPGLKQLNGGLLGFYLLEYRLCFIRLFLFRRCALEIS